MPRWAFGSDTRRRLNEGDVQVSRAIVDSIVASDLLRALTLTFVDDKERLLRELPAETAVDLIEEVPGLQARDK